MEPFNNKLDRITRLYLVAGLLLLCTGLVFGLIAALQYIIPGLFKEYLSFERVRPLHVSAMVFWIITAAIGTVQSYLKQALTDNLRANRLLIWQWSFMVFAIVLILINNGLGNFGGREYLEFPPLLAVPLIVSWSLFLIYLLSYIPSIRHQPVYVWMWLTGACFLVFTYLESYLWLIPFFRQYLMADMTIQWKANGSMVGSWNMLIYGSSIFLMEKISGEKSYGRSFMAFVLYFTGLTNLMFNWGHHIYTLPTLGYIKHISYLISMTELFIFGRIVYLWRSSLKQAMKYLHFQAYRWLLAADIWIFLNLFLAILMSVPAINVYTHGTHITVAHSMGATIGINTFLLLAFVTDHQKGSSKWFKQAYLFVNISLFVFWISLIVSGILKAIWQMSPNQLSYGKMMSQLHPFFVVFFLAGSMLMTGLLFIVFPILKKLILGLRRNNDDRIDQ